MADQKEQLQTEYELLKEIYGINSGCWSIIHENFSKYSFCPENKKSLISEYLAWEDFTERAKKLGVVYYYGIDEFLKKYKKAVYSCLQNLD